MRFLLKEKQIIGWGLAGLLIFSMLQVVPNLSQKDVLMLQKNVAQLFIDDYLIDTGSGLRRTLHMPVKNSHGNQPIIELEKEFAPYAATLEANGTIVYDRRLKKYVMFALGYSVHGKTMDRRESRWKYYRIYRITSVDGRHWLKGDDGHPQWVFPRARQDLYDSTSGTYATNIDAGSFYYDKIDSTYPYKGWRHFSNWGDDREGQYYLRSRDGIHWERLHRVVNAYGGKHDPFYCRFKVNHMTLVGPQDVTYFYFDSLKNRFLGIFKFYSPKPVKYGNRVRSRAYAFFNPPLEKPFDLSRISHVELVPPLKDVGSETRYDEYYGSTAWRYESLWLGGLRVFHENGDYPWSAAGCAFLRLVVSHDGLHWHKVNFPNQDGILGVFLPNGKEGGNNGRNDGGYMTQFTNPPLRLGDSLIFYYGSSSWGKNQPPEKKMSGGGIFRARLRLDGFVAGDAGEFVTKKLIALAAQKITLNVIGPVSITLLDRNGNRIAEETIEGNYLDYRPFQKVKNLVLFLKRGFRLRFHIGKGGHLYAFRLL